MNKFSICRKTLLQILIAVIAETTSHPTSLTEKDLWERPIRFPFFDLPPHLRPPLNSFILTDMSVRRNHHRIKPGSAYTSFVLMKLSCQLETQFDTAVPTSSVT